MNILVGTSSSSSNVGIPSVFAPSLIFAKPLYSGFQGTAFPAAAPALTENPPVACASSPDLPAGLALAKLFGQII
ncbi:MAG TPA: hypothetical protein PK683_08330 [Leptospiraceae bacterium]|nr:hypothetical protein [Leptospiraceae bacterium]HNI99157.1 hypothetical protein [Leptospiraceae bacterium]